MEPTLKEEAASVNKPDTPEGRGTSESPARMAADTVRPIAKRSTVSKAHAHPRCEDWPARLESFLETHAEKPFDWASWNCCHFARDWVQEITGVDLDRSFFAQCTGLLTAQRILQKKGGVAGLFARACHRHGFCQVHRYYAQRGDLVLFKDSEGITAVGICCGESFAAVGPSGIEYRAMSEATHAFKIG